MRKDKYGLLPCPFCGGPSNPGWFNVEFDIACNHCKFSIGRHAVDYGGDPEKAREAATAAWNRREEVTRLHLRLKAASMQRDEELAAAFRLGEERERNRSRERLRSLANSAFLEGHAAGFSCAYAKVARPDPHADWLVSRARAALEEI